VAVASEPIAGRVERLEEGALSALHDATVSLAMGGLLTVIVIAFFDWPVADVALGSLIGTAVWGPAKYLWDTRRWVPHGEIMDAPAGVEPAWTRVELRSILLVPALCVPLAWLADYWDLGAVFVPGQLYGYAAAWLFAYVAMRRWERAHGRRVLIDPGADDARPYAGAPL
jgi:hypothetical protein